MQRKTPEEIQQLLKELGAQRDHEQTLMLPNATTDYNRYYWRPSFGWVKASAGPGRPPGIPNKLPRTVPVKRRGADMELDPWRPGYQLKVGRTESGKKLGRPRKYFRGDGFDV